ncbi:hypothetical protein [Amycolatopsis sp. lyj-84]|uniref:hypothetical protein n=1 Tax=Amycolatopsis sp. lyj-84 TaxID=2789284 RepID=UPI00397D0CA4
MSDEKPPPSRAVQIARMWARVPAEHLEVALKALEPELQREHERQLESIRREDARRLEVLRNEQEERRQRHFRHLCGLWAGFALVVGMLVGVNGQACLAALLAGPSLIALAKIFVLRRSDPTDARQLEPPAEQPPA